MREKELNDIKRISAQVLSITNTMTVEVKKQGEILGNFFQDFLYI